MFTIFNGLVCPYMEYVCPVLRVVIHTALLNSNELKPFRLIKSPPLVDSVQPLTLPRSVVCLSVFYHNFDADCCYELANSMPILLTPLLYLPFHSGLSIYCPDPTCKS